LNGSERHAILVRHGNVLIVRAPLERGLKILRYRADVSLCLILRLAGPFRCRQRNTLASTACGFNEVKFSCTFRSLVSSAPLAGTVAMIASSLGLVFIDCNLAQGRPYFLKAPRAVWRMTGRRTVATVEAKKLPSPVLPARAGDGSGPHKLSGRANPLPAPARLEEKTDREPRFLRELILSRSLA